MGDESQGKKNINKKRGKQAKRSITSKEDSNSKSPFLMKYFSGETPERNHKNKTQCPACHKYVESRSINRHLDTECASNIDLASEHSTRSNYGDHAIKKRKTIDVIVIEDDEEDCKLLEQSNERTVATRSKSEEHEHFDASLRNILSKVSSGMDADNLIFRTAFNPFRCRDFLKEEFEAGVKKAALKVVSTVKCSNEDVEKKDDNQKNSPASCNSANAIQRFDASCSSQEKSKNKLFPSTEYIDDKESPPVDKECSKEFSRSSFESSATECSMQAKPQVQDDLEDDEKKFEPYYWENFNFIIDTVLADMNNSELFNSGDVSHVEKFKSMNNAAQQLYVRLFLRKHGWLKVEKIRYPKISEDLQPIFSELLANEFLVDKNTLDDVNEILHLMSAAEVRSLAQSYHIFKNGKNTPTKEGMISAIINHANNQRSLQSFFTREPQNQGSMKDDVIERSKSVLGDCIKVSKSGQELFSRFFCLFSFMNYQLNDEDSGRSTLIYRILQIKKGDLVFPSYKIRRSSMVFKSRDDVLQYSDAVQAEEEFSTAVEEKNFSKALKVYRKAKTKVDEILLQLESPDDLAKIWSAHLPIHLRRFSPEWIFFRICSKSVDVLEKKGLYDETVCLLKLILHQVTYCLRSRGALWDRLAIDTERYLKDPCKALDHIKTALNDPWVRFGARMGLLNRAKRICNALKNKHLKERMSEFEAEQLDNVNEVTISAPVFLDTSSSRRTIFMINEESSDDRGAANQSYSAVEEYSLFHYRERGYPNGVHGEGSPYIFIFTLLFWEIIFLDVEDVFLGPYQACPLDLSTDHFYEVRKDQIDRKLQQIRNSTSEELRGIVRECWLKNEGQVCVGSHWTLFDDVEQVMDVVSCLNGQIIAGICELFCKDYRNRCSGMPDLLVWNAVSRKCKAVEVKGPGDRLSNKQIIWLNVLTSLGMDAEVCYVKGVGGKRRRLSKD